MTKTLAMPIGAAAFAALLSATAFPAYAHHSSVMFDANKEMTLSGTVKRFDYANPHSHIQLAVASKNGQPAEWTIETESPLVLRRAGIDKTALQTGEKVTVRIHPLKTGGAGGSLIDLTKVNGMQFSLRGPRPYFGTWVSDYRMGQKGAG